MIMTGRSTGAASALNAAVGSYRPEVLQQLWQSMPEGMRVEVVHPDGVPRRFRGALRMAPKHPAGIDLSVLPLVMAREMAWCLFRIAESGGWIQVKDMRMVTHRLVEVIHDAAGAAPRSLTDLSVGDWQQQIARSVHRRTGALPAPGSTRIVRTALTGCYRLLDLAYDTRPWWRREEWDLTLDQRIPRRAHEPSGRQVVNFTRLKQPWLREAVQWYCKTSLDTGALTWSTVLARVHALAIFSGLLTEQGVTEPWLEDDPSRLRALMLDFLDALRSRRVTHPGPNHGQPLSAARLTTLLVSVEQFYAFMHDHQHTAAAALGAPGWLRLGPEHTRLLRRGERPRQDRHRHGPILDTTTFSAIMAGIDRLGAALAEGGLGDEQAMRMLMLLARTGRRVNEICLLDYEPLAPVGTPDATTSTFTARLRYQQTKIDGAPDTILVDDEIVAIIRAQQRWVDAHLADQGSPQTRPRYLFLAERLNRNADRPYPSSRLRTQLNKLAHLLDLRDTTGAVVNLQRTHTFRHTKATSLLNAGVPLHVVQRYLGHVSPTMTMTYAQTLASTHEAEFLRYRKITADARDLEINPRDLYDMLELDTRTDRMLPNGWCLLPPRQHCTKGNACLTCDKFATDATFLPELHTQKSRTEQLIEQRRAAFHTRTGQDMSEDNIWLAGRRQETDALGRIIVKLEQTRRADGTVQAIRGAGLAARVDSITANQDNN